MCKDGERHGEGRVSCPSTQHNVPGQGSNPGVECTNHEAIARVKLNELRWISSPIEWKGRQTNQNGGLTVCWFSFVVMPGPVRKEMQFRQSSDFSKIDVSPLSLSDINISGSFLFIYKSHFEMIFSTILYVPYIWLTFVWLVFILVFNGTFMWNLSIYLLSLLLAPLSIHRTNLSTWRPKYTLKPFFSKWPNKWIGGRGGIFQLKIFRIPLFSRGEYSHSLLIFRRIFLIILDFKC